MNSLTQTKGTPSSKRNPCPICQKDHGCKISDNLTLCLRGDRSFNVPGWKWTKEARNAMGGVFVPDNGTESTFDREEWQRKQARKREAERKRKANSLSEADRDRNARKILRQLGLATRHRANLHRRGLTDAQIEEIGYKSVEAGQRLIVPVSPDFPGVNATGDQLKNADGYLVPLFNEFGQIIGFQIAADDRERAKYPWLSQDKDFHLPNGEWPLAVRLVDGDREVRLCEGTLKPQIASYRHSKSFVGAAGGNFSASPELLKRILKAVNPDRVILDCDSGVGTNPHVQRRDLTTIKLVESFGYGVRIEWWGQFEKTPNNDIDEIKDLTAAKLLTPDEFKKILGIEEVHSQQENAAHKHWRESKKFTPTTTQDQKYVEFDLPPIGSSLVVKSGLGTGKTTNLKKRIMSALELERLERMVRDKLAQTEAKGEGVILLGSRNSLLIQICEKLGILHYQSNKDLAIIELRKPNGKIAICTNSLEIFENPEWFRNKVLIMDEFMSTINHLLLSRTHKKNRKKCINLFTTCLKETTRRIFLDGHAADWGVGYLQNLLGENHPVIKLENLYKPERPRVEFLLGCKKDSEEEEADINDYSSLTRAVLSSRRFGVISDSQKQLEALEKLLISLGLRGIRIDSKTLAEEFHPAKKFVADCDKWIYKNQPDYILLSPSVAEGIDISIRDYIKNVYGFFHGVLPIDNLRQFPVRFRDPQIHLHIWCKTFGFKNNNFNSYFSRSLTQQLIDFLGQDAKSISEEKQHLLDEFTKYISELKDDPHVQAWAKLQSIENYEKSNLRDCLREMLVADGYEVSDVILEIDKAAKASLKLAKDDIDLQTAEDIFNAKDITTEEAEAIAANFSATWGERCSVRRRGILDKLPGIEKTPFWCVDFVLEMFVKDRRRVQALETCYYWKNPSDARERQQNTWAAIALGGDSFLPDIQSQHQTIDALNYLNISELFEISQLYWSSAGEEGKLNFTAEDFDGLVKRGKHKRVVTALGFAPGADNIKYIKKVLRLIGASLCYDKRSSSNLKRYYRLVSSCQANPINGSERDRQIAAYSMACYQGIVIRHNEAQARLEASDKMTAWGELMSKFSSEIFEEKNHPQTQAQQDIDPDPDHADLFTNQASSGSHIDPSLKPDPPPETPPPDPTPEPQKINWPDFHVEIKHPRLGWVQSYFVERYVGAVAVVRRLLNHCGQIIQESPLTVNVEDIRQATAPDWWSELA